MFNQGDEETDMSNTLKQVIARQLEQQPQKQYFEPNFLVDGKRWYAYSLVYVSNKANRNNNNNNNNNRGENITTTLQRIGVFYVHKMTNRPLMIIKEFDEQTQNPKYVMYFQTFETEQEEKQFILTYDLPLPPLQPSHTKKIDNNGEGGGERE